MGNTATSSDERVDEQAFVVAGRKLTARLTAHASVDRDAVDQHDRVRDDMATEQREGGGVGVPPSPRGLSMLDA